MRTPMKRLSHPFIVPGAIYTYQLWDWDSWFTDIAIRQILKDNNGEGEAEYFECEKGCILNFLEHTEDDGYMHEYYHCDTGEGINGQRFQSWNLLVNNMIAYIEDRDPVEEF